MIGKEGEREREREMGGERKPRGERVGRWRGESLHEPRGKGEFNKGKLETPQRIIKRGPQGLGGLGYKTG